MAAVAFAGCQDDAQPPATLVAIATRPVDSGGPGTPLRVFDAVTGKTKLETEPGRWFAPAFSADGQRLFVVSLTAGGDDSEATWHFIDVGSGKDETIAVGLFELAGNMVWAPDSSRFASAGKDGLVVTDRRGKRVGEPVTGIVRADGGVSTAGLMWAKDSNLVAASINGEILFATREGKPAGKLRAEDFPGAQEGDVVQLWLRPATGTFRVSRGSRARGAVPDFFAATVANGNVTLALDSGVVAAMEAESKALMQDVAAAEKLVPGGVGASGGKTADGEGRVVEVNPGPTSPAGFRAQLVVFTSGGSLVVDPGLPAPSRLQGTYSVVITK